MTELKDAAALPAPSSDGLCERLEAAAEEIAGWGAGNVAKTVRLAIDVLRSHEALIARLASVLEPFEKAANLKLCGDWQDDERVGRTDAAWLITFGDLRRAKRARASLTKEQTDGE